MRLLVTDLDNTLYDWVTFFANAFSAMVSELVPLVGVSERTLLEEFKAVHQHYGNSEQPFAVLDLPSVRHRFGPVSREELWRELRLPLEKFEEARGKYLKLYPGVRETLERLRREGVKIVGHTEAIATNAHHRLRVLGVLEFFSSIYTLEGHVEPHPDPTWSGHHRPPPSMIHVVPKAERKPNPRLLIDICAREGVRVEDVCYVGDSLTRDVTMAKGAGVFAVWARYGTVYDQQLWNVLVKVTHWTDEDVKRESELKQASKGVQPDLAIDAFSELLHVFEGRGARPVG